MTPANRRLIVFLVLIVVAGVAAYILLRPGSREPMQDRDTRQSAQPEQTAQPGQTPLQEKETPQQQHSPARQMESPREQSPSPSAGEDVHLRIVGNIMNYRAALDDYRARNGTLPTTAQGLSVLGLSYKDPWGRDYIYNSPSTHNREEYDLFSAGPDGKPDTPDDDWGEEGTEELPKGQ